MGRGTKKKINKEDIAESWCFVCKDGGSLRVCDYTPKGHAMGCLKAYHPYCVEKDDSFLESENPWNCNWHFCFICKKPPKFHCFCCPKAVCGRCLCVAEFVVLREHKGFCNHCLALVGLIEGIKKPDSDEGKIDFSDKDTYECLFKCYWEVIQRKEAVKLKLISSAIKCLKEGKDHGNCSDVDDISDGDDTEDEDENQLLSDNDYMDDDDTKEILSVCNKKRKKGKPCMRERKVQSKKNVFIGWGSKPLFHFLASIGKDTSKELSQLEVVDIIIAYCKEHKLFDPVKKKKVHCDATVRSLLRRKSVNKNSIYNHLNAHFVKNFEQFEDVFEYSSEGKDENVLMASKRQRKSSSERKAQNKEVVPHVQRSCFASFIDKNIKLVYLRRSLVKDLLKQPETFDAKVIGSFVRIKSDPNDYLQKNSHQLLQVTGVKNVPTNGEMNLDIQLQVSGMIKDVLVCELSDVDFTEEECQDLHWRAKEGLIRKLTVVEFEHKVHSLHEVITKHWIARELSLLKNLINQANEKGWRRELSKYMDRMLLLQTPEEQSRLLHEVPKIVADEAEVESSSEDLSGKDDQENHGSWGIAFIGTSKHPKKKISQGSERYCCPNDKANAAEEKEPHKGFASNELHQQFSIPGSKSNAALQTERPKAFQDVRNTAMNEASQSAPLSRHHLTSVPQSRSSALLPEKQHQPGNAVLTKKNNELVDAENGEMKEKNNTQTVGLIAVHDDKECDAVSGEKRNRKTATEYEKVKQLGAKAVELIELSDEEEQEAGGGISKQTSENLMNRSMWHCTGPDGVTRGPYSLSVLKEWSDSSSCPQLRFKVWRTGQCPEQAVFLTDVIRRFFSVN